MAEGEQKTSLLTEVVYLFKDQTPGPLAKLQQSLKITGMAAQGVGHKLTEMRRSLVPSTLAAVGLGAGFGALAHQVIAANVELEKAQKRIAGTLFAMENWGKSLSPVQKVTIAMEEAKGVVAELEEAEEKLAIPFEAMASSYSRLAAPAFKKLGLNQKQLTDLTVSTTAAARVLGVDSERAAMTVSRALLTKSVRGVDAFSMSLKVALGNAKKLSTPEVYRRIQMELEKLKPAAEKMSQGFEGSLFRLKDFFEDTLRDIGKPVVEAIAKRLDDWRKRLSEATDHGRKLADWGKQVLGVFETLGRVTMKILEHWKAIALVYAGLKIGGMMSAAGGMLSAAGAASPLLGALGGMASAIGPVVVGLGALAAAAQLGAELLDKHQTEQINLSGEAAGMEVAFKQLTHNTKAAFKIAKSYNLVNEQGVVDTAALTKRFEALSANELATFGKEIGMVGANAHLLAVSFAAGLKDYKPDALKPPEPPKPEDIHPKGIAKGNLIQNFNGDIKITQDFKDQDPSRVMMRFKDDLEGLSEKRQQSNLATVHGQ